MTKEEKELAIAQDSKMWYSEEEYKIEVNDFDYTVKTELPRGSELVVYSKSEHATKTFWFADPEGNWIQYKRNDEE